MYLRYSPALLAVIWLFPGFPGCFSGYCPTISRLYLGHISVFSRHLIAFNIYIESKSSSRSNTHKCPVRDQWSRTFSKTTVLFWFPVCLDQMIYMRKPARSLTAIEAGLWIQPIMSDYSSCCQLFMNSTNFRQKILDSFISIISSRLFIHCEHHLRPNINKWTAQCRLQI